MTIKTTNTKHAEIEFNEFGARTTFDDGSFVDARPAYEGLEGHHYHVVSHRCGYGDDLIRYCQEHELAHTVVCEFLYNDVSFVLFNLAHGRKPHEPHYEELMAQTLQRFVRAGERPIIADVDWDGMRDLFLRYAESASEPVTAGADGWVEWHGGNCPVPGHVSVDVRFRGGGKETSWTAGRWYWTHHGGRNDIVAYRVSEQRNAP